MTVPNYSRIYAEFIADRRGREDGLQTFDRHHVVPRCMGGGDEPENLVRLSWSDHLFAHILLAKMHGGLLAVSANRMAGMAKYRGRRTRERYAHLRAGHRAAVSQPCPPEKRAAIAEAKRGWEPTDETRRNMSSAAKRRADDPAWRARHGAVMMGNKHMLGRSPSPETRAKISATLKRRAEEKRNAQ